MAQTPQLRNQNKLWKGIAIAGIWIGTGISAFADPMVTLGVSFFACMLTMFLLIGKK